MLFDFINMFEAVWGGLLGGFGHTVFYPVNPNPPQATSTHLTHLYLTLPYHTRVVWGGGGGELRVVWGVLGWFWGGLGVFLWTVLLGPRLH